MQNGQTLSCSQPNCKQPQRASFLCTTARSTGLLGVTMQKWSQYNSCMDCHLQIFHKIVSDGCCTSVKTDDLCKVLSIMYRDHVQKYSIKM